MKHGIANKTRKGGKTMLIVYRNRLKHMACSEFIGVYVSRNETKGSPNEGKFYIQGDINMHEEVVIAGPFDSEEEAEEYLTHLLRFSAQLSCGNTNGIVMMRSLEQELLKKKGIKANVS